MYSIIEKKKQKTVAAQENNNISSRLFRVSPAAQVLISDNIDSTVLLKTNRSGSD